jgi:hypothetical protein
VENEAAFPEKSGSTREDKKGSKKARFVRQNAVKHESRGMSGSCCSKSGSIRGHERIGAHEKTRTNALRSGPNA